MAEFAENEELFFEPRHPYSRAMLSAMPTLEENRYDAATCLLDAESPSPVNIPPECEEPIPEARRLALPGVKLCIDCMSERDGARQMRGGINRRGSKDSQLK